MSVDLEALLRSTVQPLLGLTSAGFLGFMWFQSGVADRGSALRKGDINHAVFGLASVTGGAFLTKWNGTISPANGLAWIVGLGLGFWGAYRHVLRTIVDSVLVQSGHDERSQVLSVVRSKLLREGAKNAEQQALACIKFTAAPQEGATVRAAAQLHKFIHEAREHAVRAFAKIGRNFAEAARGHATFSPDLSSYLDEVVSLYRELLVEITGESQGLWVALRRLNPDGNYGTIIRKGDVDNSARARRSEVVPADKGLPRLLELDLNTAKNATRGVLFLTPDSKRKKTGKWHKMANDERREDLYQVIAPITIRLRVSDGSISREMLMILYANHMRDVFRKWHCDIVRCCVDTVSTALSVGFQLLQAASERGVETAAPPPSGAAPALLDAQVSGATAEVRSINSTAGEIADASRRT